MIIKLKTICNFKEGYVNPSQKINKYFDGPIKWCRANDVNYKNIYNTSRTLTNEGFNSAGKSALLFKPNSIVLTKSGTIGRCAIIKDYMCGNRAIINIELKTNNINDTKYLYYFLESKRSYLESIAVGSVQKNLYVSLLENVEIDWPDSKERDYIVDIIGSLDEKIENNENIIKNLKELLSCETNKLINNSHTTMELGTIIKERKEKIKTEQIPYSVINSGEVVIQSDKFNKEIAKNTVNKYKMIMKDYFVYNPSRINIGSIGIMKDGIGCVSPIYIVFTVKNEYKNFINELIRFDNIKTEFIKKSSGSVRQALSYDSLCTILIPLIKEKDLEKYNTKYETINHIIECFEKEINQLYILKQKYLLKYFQ